MLHYFILMLQDAEKTLRKARTIIIDGGVSSANVTLQEAMIALRKERDERYANGARNEAQREDRE